MATNLTLTLNDSQAKALELLRISAEDATNVAFSAFKSQIKSRINAMAKKANEESAAVYDLATKSGFQTSESKEDFVRKQSEAIHNVLTSL